MSLIDRDKHMAGTREAQRLSERIQEAAAKAQPKPVSARPRAGARGSSSRFGRILYASGVGVALCTIVAAIGGTGSFFAGSVAFGLAAGSALMVILDRPPSVRTFYARRPNSAIALHVAFLIGAIVAWGDTDYALERLNMPAAAEPEPAEGHAGAPARAALSGPLAGGDAAHTSEQLRALLAAAQAAVSARDWRGAALAQAVVIDKHLKGGTVVTGADRELLDQLASVAAHAREQEQREDAEQTSAEIAELVSKAEDAKAAGHWSEAEAAVDQAQVARQAHEKSDNHQPLDAGVLQRAAALSSEIQTRVARETAQRAAVTQVQQLQLAYQRAEQFGRAARWDEADKVYRVLLEAIDDVPAQVKAEAPPGFSFERFQARVRKRAQLAREHTNEPR
ncbi:MAG: hypothetical protein RL701_4352 [Pseudomonadota bacterium]|jgi:hypothetical protein